MFSSDTKGNPKLDFFRSPSGKLLANFVIKKWGTSFNKIDIKFLYSKIPKVNKMGVYSKPSKRELEPYIDKLNKYIYENNPSFIIIYGALVRDSLIDKKQPLLKYEIQPLKYYYDGHYHTIPTSINPGIGQYSSLGLASKITLNIENRYIKKLFKSNGDITVLEPAMGKYEHIKDFSRVQEVFEKEIPKHKIVALDFETNTLDVWRKGAKAIMVSISWKEHQGITIPISHKKYPDLWSKQEYEQLIKYILDLVEGNQWIVMHNAMYDIYMLMTIYKLKKAVHVVDTMIMYYIAKHEVTVDEHGKPILRNLKQLAYEETDMGGYENERDKYFSNLINKWYDDWYNKEKDRLYQEALKEGKKAKLPKKNSYVQPRNEIDGSNINFEWLPLEVIEPYAAGDTDVTLQLYNKYLKLIKKNKSWVKLIFDFYPKLEDTVCYMQSKGVYMDKELLNKYDPIYTKYRDSLLDDMKESVPEIKKFEQERLEKLNKRTSLMEQYKPAERTSEVKKFIDVVGKELRGTDSSGIEKWKFTPSSSKKVGYILYEMLGYELPLDKAYVTKGAIKKLRKPSSIIWSDFSTGKNALEYIEKQYNSSFARDLLQYSGVNKLITSFIKAYPDMIDSNSCIHPRFNAIGTQTGRMSSSNPNYQQIPKPSHDPDSPIYAYPIKGLTKSRFKNGIFINADYKSLEIYIAALFSKDGGVTETLMQPGSDIHRRNASIAFGVDQKEVTPEQRQSAKKVSFGTIYGQTPAGMAESWGISEEEAKERIDKVLSAMPQIKQAMQAVQGFVKRYGYVETMQGNYRRLPDAKSSNEYVSSRALRQSFNAVIQGSAAYMTNTSLIMLRKLFYKLKLKSVLCLTVHDSIGVDVHPDEIKIVPALVKKVMENPLVPWLKCKIDDFTGLHREKILDKYKIDDTYFKFPLVSELEWGKAYSDGFDWDYDLYNKLGIDKYYEMSHEKSYISDYYNDKITETSDSDKKDKLLATMKDKLAGIDAKYLN